MNWLQRKYWHYKLKGSPYQSLFCTPDKTEYVSLDCETTSLDPNRAELVTIAATKIIDNRIITSQPFEVRLRAPQSLDSGSVKIHRIRHQDLVDGISEKEALLELLDFIGNRPLVGYHIRYDKKILDLACLRQLGFPLPNPLIEVSQIYHDKLERHLPNAYFDLSLDAICKHLELPIQDKHDALQDAISAALVFVRLTKGDLPNLTAPYT
ncbi:MULTISPECIES: 3'-5' exonuclease [Vibrio]|mgnify:CR=1 FL=1|jgi:DNA polymerase-3 subunit epsilon|uniref:3'-5' exonuclease n=6 Tax=Vibrio TaxID=662 RepID=A0AAN2P803_9VIBR|nr:MULTISPECIES: 3'-5' exonuclease [Vibrio]EEZ82736.1 putative DNA polymerase III, epsilon subunit [Vibrio alginolyticus 40B]KOY46222.1 DNA polymerase III subunit epsilon [Vibrio parahaemolyticus]MDW1811032.1 3'-5' exonuclease [Vibrio sp. Vb2362]MDW1970026.1 3'-5' exonuclease [Vibrio sp. 945]MDW2260452.1 3'-5' exonuclease [Vibrio sp. 1409]MDW2297128.1 3'-5' exonuclease [Vibrio sp. 1404]MEA3484255.1 3'-5' exonuclease [Pseudomonadota bacterium]QCO87380.1 3'-5' exonuclease [Vibrio neocaledonic